MNWSVVTERQRILTVTIHDCEVQTFRAGGKGGQNQNKRDTGVRVIHHPSGARGEARDERSQKQNKRRAFLRMVNTKKFETWRRVATGQIAMIDKKFSFNDGDFLIEYLVEGKWVTDGDGDNELRPEPEQ